MERCFGKIRNEKKVCSTTAALRAPRRARQFFPKATSIDLEAQKNLDQKNHSNLEINSLKHGDALAKWGEIRPKNFRKTFFRKFNEHFEKSNFSKNNQKF